MSKSDDTVSRQAAIDAVIKESNTDGAYGYMDTKSIIDLLNDLPPAEPERKTGKWIKVDMHAKCTACGQECYVPTCMGEPMYTYCPNCGARMEGENEAD